MKIDYKVKSWTKYFQEIKAGSKKHDMRDRTERDYKVGTILLLEEYDHFNGRYTGETLLVRITYITDAVSPCAFSSAWLDKKACILSLEIVPWEEIDE